MELAHANRVATMGQLTASIAHEVKQPVAAMTTTAQAALRWLCAEPPALEEVRQGLARIVRDGNRADDVIGRVRRLIEKAPPRRDALEINEAIREVIALLHGEVVKHAITVRTRLADDVPLVQGDRVQLQQVILNLVVNAIEAMHGVPDGARDLLISTEGHHYGGRAGRGAGYRAGAGSRDVRTAVRGFLHDQARWPGHGFVDLPLDHRGAWRAAMALDEQQAWRDVPIHVARGCHLPPQRTGTDAPRPRDVTGRLTGSTAPDAPRASRSRARYCQRLLAAEFATSYTFTK